MPTDIARIVLEDNRDGRLVVDISPRGLYFHVKVYCWGAHKLREYRHKFDAYLEMFKDVGYTEARATPVTSNVRAIKLIKLFGFHEVRNEHGFTLMERTL